MDRLTLSNMVVTELLGAIRKMGTHRGPSKNSHYILYSNATYVL